MRPSSIDRSISLDLRPILGLASSAILATACVVLMHMGTADAANATGHSGNSGSSHSTLSPSRLSSPVRTSSATGVSFSARAAEIGAAINGANLPPVPAARIQDPPAISDPFVTSAGQIGPAQVEGGPTIAPAALTDPVAPETSGPDTSVVELSSGGSAAPIVVEGTAASGTTASTAAAPASTPSATQTPLTVGGGGPTLSDCMELWDTSSGMSKREWKTTCIRTMNGTELTLKDLPALDDVNSIVGDNFEPRGHKAQR